MIRSMFTVGGFTLMSRILGFIRDKLIALYLGSGGLGDVWVTAFRFPNLFRRIFGEGAFNAAFVPMYGQKLEEDGEEVADAFARRTLAMMLAFLISCFVLAFIFMEPIVRLTNIGYVADGRFEPAVTASRITVGYLIFICLVAGLSGILNTRRSFAAPAFSYVVLNIVFLGSLVYFVPKSDEPLIVLSWTVIVSGVLQLAVVFIACLRRGVNLKPRLPVIDGDIKRLGLLMAPGLVSAGVQQLNLLVGQSVASIELGGQVLIYFADRINQLPLGLIGMAGGVVLLTEITRHLGSGDKNGAKRCLNQGIEMALLLSLPAMVAMIVIPREIMYAIFEGGEFTGESAIDAGWVLAAFALGTPAYVLTRILQTGYFARQDTKTPMRFTIASAVTNIVLVYPMFLWLGPTGCALATSIAGWVSLILLWGGLQRAGIMGLVPGFLSRIARMLLASAIMGGAVWGLAQYSNQWIMREDAFFLRVAVMGAIVIAGVAVYLLAVVGTGVYSLSELKSVVRRRRPKTNSE